jgi:hypothetical protein
MRVLTVPQPFAQLIVCGLRESIVRAVDTDHRGPLAIHAAATVPSHDAWRRSRDDRELAADFDDMGWRGRKDLLDLPRSAVVGVVHLVAVTRAHEHNGSAGGALKGADELAPNEVVLEFTDAVAIAPVSVAKGKSNVWTLPNDVAQSVADAESAARAGAPAPVAGEARNPLPDLTPPFDHRISPPREAPHGDFQSWHEQMDEDRGLTGPPVFLREETERVVARAIDGYIREHQVRGSGVRAEVRVDHRLPYLVVLFGRRAWVPVQEFRLVVRKHLRSEAGSPILYPGERRFVDPYDDFSALDDFGDYPARYETDSGDVVDTGFTELDKPRRRKDVRSGEDATGDDGDAGDENENENESDDRDDA